MDDEEEILNDLLGQLKENTSFNNKAMKNHEHFELPKEELEKFILNTSGRLVKDSLDMIDIVKERVAGAAEPEDVASLSELFKASTSTIEALNKVLLQDKKAMTTLAVKKMDIDSKKELAETETKARMMASREEVMEQLIKDAKLIDATVDDTSDVQTDDDSEQPKQ